MTTLLTEHDAMDPRASRARPPDDNATSPRSGATYWTLIDRSDDALLDFDTEELEHDIDHARALLARHPTTYRNHLTIAKFIDGWITRIANDAKHCRFNEGFVQALVDITGHLRDGDFAAEPDDDVGYEGSTQSTEIGSSNGDPCTRGRGHQFSPGEKLLDQ